MNSDSNNPFVLLWENRKENLTERYEVMQLPGGVMFKFWIQQEPNPPDVSLEFVPGICLEHEEDGSFCLVKKPDIDSFTKKCLDDSKKRAREGLEPAHDSTE